MHVLAMTTTPEREALIEKAATDAANAVGGYARLGYATFGAAAHAARAILAFFEESQKPTEDEREARERILAKFDRFPDAEAIMLSREDVSTALRRPVSPEPTEDKREPDWSHPDAIYSPEVFMSMQGLLSEAKGSPTHALRLAVSRSIAEPQAEPTDVQVRSAWFEWISHDERGPEEMRAALRAAFAVEGDRRG